MYKAKAFIGEKAGEVIYAKDHDLTHGLCKLWKIYCPECKQFLYFSKSKDPDKRRSYFGHYDYEDKRCPERSLVTNQGHQSASLTESHEQDLETAELFVEQVFYGIDPEYFQNLNREENEEESQQVTDAIKWFRSSLPHDCKNWVKHYCHTTGFLDWNNPEREISYVMDWLYVLARREDILKNLFFYFASIYSSADLEIDTVQSKLEIFDPNKKEEGLIWLLTLKQVIEHLSSVAKDRIFSSGVGIVSLKTFVELKIPPNHKKTPFRGKTSVGAYVTMGLSYILPDNSDQARIFVNQYKDHIYLRKSLVDRFLYVSQDELMHGPGLQEILEVNNFLLLDTDFSGDLCVKGFAEKRHSKKIIGGISEILFNKTSCSMLLFLREGFISEKIAEKAAQLALKFECGDLSPSDAFEEFARRSRKYS